MELFKGAIVLFKSPMPLPEPLDQGDECRAGQKITIRLSNVEEIEYGPCRRPKERESLRLLLLRMVRERTDPEWRAKPATTPLPKEDVPRGRKAESAPSGRSRLVTGPSRRKPGGARAVRCFAFRPERLDGARVAEGVGGRDGSTAVLKTQSDDGASNGRPRRRTRVRPRTKRAGAPILDEIRAAATPAIARTRTFLTYKLRPPCMGLLLAQLVCRAADAEPGQRTREGTSPAATPNVLGRAALRSRAGGR
jgi:hypothetical protein